MTPVPFGEAACERTRRYLDSYISSELLVETNHEVLRHLEGCAACTAEFANAARVKSQVKAAVDRQPIPPDLPVRVRQRIEQHQSRSWLSTGWSRWAVAAATVVVCTGTWLTYTRDRLPAVGDRPAQAVYIQRISERLAAVLKVGLGDHIHCSVFRKYPKDPPSVAQMEEKLGPAYQGLLPIVTAAVPGHYKVIMAHQCTYAGRHYIHLTLHDGTNLVSLVITRKNPGESLAGLSTSEAPSGIPVYQSPAQRYEIAGFETDRYLAFVVSDLSGKQNLQMAEVLAPAVHAFLMQS